MSVCRQSFVVLALIVVLGMFWQAESRYLPTRSDESRKEQIKDVLRALLELAPEGRDFEGASNYPYEHHLNSVVKKRSVSSSHQADAV